MSDPEQQVFERAEPRFFHLVRRPLLRAGRVHINFINRTPYMVNLYWINYGGGSSSLYKSISMGCYLDLNANAFGPQTTLVVGRPPRRQETDGGESYLYMSASPNKDRVKSYIKVFPIVAQDRKKIEILTLPMFTLKNCCSLRIIEILKANRGDVKDLNLPTPLIEELETVMKKPMSISNSHTYII